MIIVESSDYRLPKPKYKYSLKRVEDCPEWSRGEVICYIELSISEGDKEVVLPLSYEDARVFGFAKICGKSLVCGNASVCGNVQISGENVCSPQEVSDTTPIVIVDSDKKVIGIKHGDVKFVMLQTMEKEWKIGE